MAKGVGCTDGRTFFMRKLVGGGRKTFHRHKFSVCHHPLPFLPPSLLSEQCRGVGRLCLSPGGWGPGLLGSVLGPEVMPTPARCFLGPETPVSVPPFSVILNQVRIVIFNLEKYHFYLHLAALLFLGCWLHPFSRSSSYSYPIPHTRPTGHALQC